MLGKKYMYCIYIYLSYCVTKNKNEKNIHVIIICDFEPTILDTRSLQKRKDICICIYTICVYIGGLQARAWHYGQ